jgi:uncharacterized protein YuzE
MTTEYRVTFSESFPLGSSLTWDGEAKAGYLHIDANPDCCAVARTIDLGTGVHVDVDHEGRIRGIETLGRPVQMHHLLVVLRWCRFNDDFRESWDAE